MPRRLRALVEVSCRCTDPGNVFCWGNNGAGQLGDGTQADSTQPVQVLAGETSDEEEFVGNARDMCQLRQRHLRAGPFRCGLLGRR